MSYDSYFYDGDKVKILKGRYDGYNAIIDRWLHDDWYMAEVINPHGDDFQIVLNSGLGEKEKAQD